MFGITIPYTIKQGCPEQQHKNTLHQGFSRFFSFIDHSFKLAFYAIRATSGTFSVWELTTRCVSAIQTTIAHSVSLSLTKSFASIRATKISMVRVKLASFKPY